MLWQCSKGHEWLAKFIDIKHSKTWCPHCFHNEKRGKSRVLGIERAREYAAKRDLSILDSVYKNSYSPLNVHCNICSTSYITTLHKITHNGACPGCSKRPRANEEEAVYLATKKGGKLLGFAEVVKKNSTWECAKGHEWRATWSSVKKGSWCPYCAGKKSQSNIHKKAVSKLYQHQRADAIKGFVCTLTVNDLVAFLHKKCAYCGRPASNVDRKDSNIGHTLENCVPSCWRCNRMKGSDVKYEVMLKIGALLKDIDP